MKIAVAVAGCALLLFVASAEAYTVLNGDFESPTAAPFNPVIDNWGQSDQGGTGVVHRTATGGGTSYVPNPPNGSDQWAYLLPGQAIWQNIGLVEEMTYILNYAVGDRTGHVIPAPLTISIWAGGTGPTAGQGATLLDSAEALLPADNGGVRLNSTSLEVVGGTHVGETLWLKFSSGPQVPEAAQVLIDDVVVTPEPATVALMGLGLAAVLALRKGTDRKKRQ